MAGKSVTSAGEVRDAITAARNDNKNSVLMRVKSGGSSRFVRCAFGQGITIYELEGVAGISRPRRRRFPGGGPFARSHLVPFDGIRPPPSEGLRAVRSPSFTARFFQHVDPNPTWSTDQVALHVQVGRAMVRESSVTDRNRHASPTMRLLIIEDDREAADYLVKAFREAGHVADLAGDGEEGLSLAETAIMTCWWSTACCRSATAFR